MWSRAAVLPSTLFLTVSQRLRRSRRRERRVRHLWRFLGAVVLKVLRDQGVQGGYN